MNDNHTPDHPSVEEVRRHWGLAVDIHRRPERLAEFDRMIRSIQAETWGKFQEHYAAEWEEAYPEAIFPSPAPPPATVSRESVAASMMRHWVERLRTDRNPYEETPNDRA